MQLANLARAGQFLSTPSSGRAHRGPHFYPRPPRGGRPRSALRPSNSTRHFYPRPPRGGRLHTIRVNGWGESISIHALREEGDASCGSLRYSSCYFYPRPPRGGRHEDYRSQTDSQKFLSTPSARRATDHRQHSAVGRQISIHALREEGDGHGPRWWTASRNFYPRPPRGGRHAPLPEKEDDNAFLSTPSARRATDLVTGMASGMKHFYPRPPRGGRPGEQTFVHVL